MVGLVLVAVAGVLLVLFAADRLVKARERARWRRQMTSRLAQATARADQQQRQRQASVQASKAVTSVMPAISRPPMSPPGRPKRRGGNEHTGPNARVASHPGGRSSRGSEQPGRSAGRP